MGSCEHYIDKTKTTPTQFWRDQVAKQKKSNPFIIILCLWLAPWIWHLQAVAETPAVNRESDISGVLVWFDLPRSFSLPAQYVKFVTLHDLSFISKQTVIIETWSCDLAVSVSGFPCSINNGSFSVFGVILQIQVLLSIKIVIIPCVVVV